MCRDCRAMNLCMHQLDRLSDRLVQSLCSINDSQDRNNMRRLANAILSHGHLFLELERWNVWNICLPCSPSKKGVHLNASAGGKGWGCSDPKGYYALCQGDEDKGLNAVALAILDWWMSQPLLQPHQCGFRIGRLPGSAWLGGPMPCVPMAAVEAVPRPPTLDEVLGRLYDASIMGGNDSEVASLLRQYQQLTGKKRPQFMR